MIVPANILFYAKKTKTTSTGLVPVYMRVTINGSRFEVTTQQYIKLEQWSKAVGRVKGNGEEARKINALFDAFRGRVLTYQIEVLSMGQDFTIEKLRLKWFGLSAERPRMLLEIFEQHNSQMSDLVGRDFAPLTLKRYKTSIGHSRNFLKWKFGIEDIDIEKLNYEFLSDHEFWFKSVRKCNHNTTMKYLANFKKIVNFCIKNNWLARDPFVGFKMTKREVEREFLSQEELSILSSKTFMTARVGQIRDIFLFCCYTGMSYIDVKKLTSEKMSIGIDGEKWIFIHRQKTETASRIPLLPQAQAILEKYATHPYCVNKGCLLPVLSNQKMNEYLKEIGDLCGIKKKMTTHTAGHTFATTVTLTNGVPIESVSRMLGHKSLKTTQHYAKILDIKVSEDMSRLRAKLNSSAVKSIEAAGT